MQVTLSINLNTFADKNVRVVHCMPTVEFSFVVFACWPFCVLLDGDYRDREDCTVARYWVLRRLSLNKVMFRATIIIQDNQSLLVLFRRVGNIAESDC